MKNLSVPFCKQILLAGACAGLWMPAQAIQFSGDNYGAVIRPFTCGYPEPVADNFICAQSNSPSFAGTNFVPDQVQGGTGSYETWSLNMGISQAQLDLSYTPSQTPHGGNASSVVVGYSFSNYLISGPAGDVPVSVTISMGGSAARLAGGGGYQFMQYSFDVGTRNLAAGTDLSSPSNGINPVTGLRADMLTFFGDGDRPVIANDVNSGSFMATAGTPFEFGYVLLGYGMNFRANIQVTMALSAPAGYTLASVTPIPEPETWAMLLAGLGLLGAVVRRNQHKKNC